MLSQAVRACAGPPRLSAIRATFPRRQHLSPRALSTSPSPSPEDEADPSAEVFEALHSAPSQTSTSDSNARPVISRATRTAFIRTWKPLHNIADAYALMRAIERKYGKILETHFLRDYEIPTNYQTMSWIVFADPKSLQRIPEKGFDFSIPTTGVKKEPHEWGMEDLENLAKEGDYQKDYEFAPVVDDSSKKDVIGGRILRAEMDYFPESVERGLFQSTSKHVMRTWLQWGGFAHLQPLESSKALSADDLFNPEKEAQIDHIRMRASLQLAASVTKTRNPAVRQASPREKENSKESFGSTVFSGLLQGKAQDTAAEEKVVNESSTSESPSSTTETTSTSDAELSSPPSSSSPSITTPPPGPTPPTPEQLAMKEALNRQIEVARQLRQHISPPRRKQAKPAVRTPRSTSPTTPKTKPQPEPEFFNSEKVEEQVAKEAEKPSGVLKRLWGMIGL